MGGGTGTGVSADGPQPASNVKTVIESKTARTSIMAPNDEVERRGCARSNEDALSQSSIPSLAQRRRHPRSLEPMLAVKPVGASSQGACVCVRPLRLRI